MVSLLPGVGESRVPWRPAGELHQVIQKEVSADARIECLVEVLVTESVQQFRTVGPVGVEFSRLDWNVCVEIEQRPGEFHPYGIADEREMRFGKGPAQSSGAGKKQEEVSKLIEPEDGDLPGSGPGRRNPKRKSQKCLKEFSG